MRERKKKRRRTGKRERERGRKIDKAQGISTKRRIERERLPL